MKQQIREMEKEHIKKNISQVEVGDTVDVHYRIREENKIRVQVFSGIVIGEKGTGLGKNFTVRRISYGEGVERVFPFNSPAIEKIVVKRHGKTRRAKLYYLRKKEGTKVSKIREKIVQTKNSESSE